MEPEPARRDVAAVARVADRLESLADVADLMDDPVGAARLRGEASELRLRAMALLDE